jgi:hypothetical protein
MSDATPDLHDLDAYDGEWVLLRSGAVVDHDPDPDALRDRVEPLAAGDAIVPIGHPPAGYNVIA